MATKPTPIPVHEDIVLNNRPTQALVRYFTNIIRDIFNASTENIVDVGQGNIQLEAGNQLILADATDGEINITLPSPSLNFVAQRSFKIDITKIDATENIVNILPFDSELVVYETQQELLYQGEVLNFSTDGINWHLYA